jgi:hypothetical protein
MGVLVAESCKVKNGVSKTVDATCENALPPLLNSNWTYVSEGNYHVMTDTFRKAIETEYYQCFVGKDTAWLIKNFGAHQNKEIAPDPIRKNDSIAGSIRYQLSPMCDCQNTRCSFYFFFYDFQGKIVRHRYDYWHVNCKQ